MKKLPILIAFILCAGLSFGQGVPIVNNYYTSNPATQYHVVGLLTGDVAVKIPTLDTLLHPATTFAGSIIRNLDGFAYMSNGVFWERIGFTSGDTLLAELPLYIDINAQGQRVLKILHADGIVTPGYVSWSGSGLTFDVTSALYYINYQQYISPSSQITLAPSNFSNPRIDKIGVDTNSSVIAVTGTAAATPIVPQLNPSSQLSLTDIYLQAGDTIPSGIRQIIIYDENVEWQTDTTGTNSVDYDNTDNPYHLVKSAFVQTYTDQSALTFTDSGSDTAQANEILKLFIYSNGTFGGNIYFQLWNGSTAVTNQLALNAQFGFNPLDSNAWQNVTIPFNAFNFVSGNIFNKLVITMGGADTTGAKGLYFDYIQLQLGGGNIPISPNNKVDSVFMVGNLEYYAINGIYTFITDLSHVPDTVFTRKPIAVDTTTRPGKQILYLLHLNGLESGSVTIDSCLTIDVTPAVYYLNYNQYNSSAAFGLPIATPNAGLPRIDIVVADTNLVISIITGTPSATPIAPTYNSFYQVKIAEILVGAGVTCIGTQEIINDGIIDDPAQWDTATLGTISVNFSNAANPYHLAQAAYIVTYTDSSQLIFTKPSGTNTLTATSVLKGFIYVVGGFSNQISGQWFNGSVAVSNQLLLNPYFNVSDSNQYQIFAPPLNAWSWPGGNVFNKLVLTFGGNDISGAKGLYLDYIQLQTGISNVATALQLTTIGSSGAATLINNVLNIPVYTGGSVTDTSFEWSVRDSLSTPAVLPNEGSIFLVGTSPTGLFVGHANNIATYDSIPAIYTFDTASVGDLLYNATTQFVSQLIGGTWVRIGRAVLHQGGDTYAATIVAGARDNFGLNLITRDTTRVAISAAGSKFSNSVLNGNFINVNPTVTGQSPKVTFFYGGASQIDLSTNSGGSRFLTSVGLDVNGKATAVGLISNYINSPNGDAFNTNPAGGSLLLIGSNTPSYINFTNEGNFFSGALGTQAATGDLAYYRNPSTNNVFNGTEVFRAVRSTGNFLIGTPTDIPISKFTVFDTLRGSIPAPKMSAAQRLTLGNAILTASIGAGGTGYTNGVYSAVALTGGSGTGATANITVSGGIVTSVTVVARGKNFTAGNNLSSASIGAGSGFLYNISSVTGALTSGLLVWDTDTLCLMQYTGSAWQSLCSSGGGGGSETMQQTFDNSVAALDNPIISLGGNVFNINEASQPFLYIDPTINIENATLRAYNATDNSNVARVGLFVTDTQAESYLEANFNDGVKDAQIYAYSNATESEIDYTADEHTFNVATLLTVTDGVNAQLSIDPISGASSLNGVVGAKSSGYNAFGDGFSMYAFDDTVSITMSAFTTGSIGSTFIEMESDFTDNGVLEKTGIHVFPNLIEFYAQSQSAANQNVQFRLPVDTLLTVPTHIYVRNNTGNLLNVYPNPLVPFTPANSTDATWPNGTTAVDDSFIYFRTSGGTWKKIPWVVF